MIRFAGFLLVFIFPTLLTAQPPVAQRELNVTLTRDQKTTATLGINNVCTATHTYELTANPETKWLRTTSSPIITVAPKEGKSFVVELNSLGLDPGTYISEAPATCVDCASEPRCSPTRIVFLLLMKVLWSSVQVKSWTPDEYVAGEVLVTLRGDPKEMKRLLRELELAFQLKVQEIINISSTGAVVVLFRSLNPSQSIPDLIGQMQRDPRINSIQLNRIYTGFNAQSRDYESLQYGPGLIRADLVSAYSTGKGVRIALIDTGVDDHPDLKGKIIDRENFTNDRDYRRDIHGTIMAGIISAIPRNGFGINGVAPDARIISVKVLKQESGRSKPVGTSFAIVRGVDYAILKKANIVNMSFGAPGPDPNVSRIVRTAVSRGMVVVAAAGDGDPRGRPIYPAALSEVIAVSALGRDWKPRWSGASGDYIDLAAPGVGILSTQPGNTFRDSDGSSEAAAHVTGVVALLFEKKANASPSQIQDLLERTSLDLGSKGKDSIFGSGIVDACKALEALLVAGKICPD